MGSKRAEVDMLVQQIEHLKRSVCDEQYRYTHEYLDLAMTAARREAPCTSSHCDDDENTICDMGKRGVADPIIVH